MVISFHKISGKYEAFLFDAYGVLKNHTHLIPGARQTLSSFHDQNIPFYVVTNDASRSPSMITDWYNQNGVEFLDSSQVISSGSITAQYLSYQFSKGSTIVYLGNEASAHYLYEAGFQAVSILDYDLFAGEKPVAVAILDATFLEEETLSIVDKALNLVRDPSLPVLLANPDITYPLSNSKIALAAGAIGSLLELASGRDILRFGKPFSPIFEYAFSLLKEKGIQDKRDVLFVGDTLETDIKGANDFGFDTALVLTGISTKENYNQLIQKTGIKPTYVCPSIAIE